MNVIQEAIELAGDLAGAFFCDDGFYFPHKHSLNHLLSLVAENQRVRDLAIHSINRVNPFHVIKEKIHKAPLVTETLSPSL